MIIRKSIGNPLHERGGVARQPRRTNRPPRGPEVFRPDAAWGCSPMPRRGLRPRRGIARAGRSLVYPRDGVTCAVRSRRTARQQNKMQRAGSPPVLVTRFAEYLLFRFVLFAWMVVVMVQLQCVWMRASVVDFFLCANE